jgi:DNA polymerase I-like protein with 3'-5' exonuclease and polymerase domains
VRLEWFKRVPNIRIGLEGFDRYISTQMLITRDKFNLDGIEKLLKKSRIVALDWETWAEPNENFILASKKSKNEYIDMFGSQIAGVGITCGMHLEKTFYFQFDHADTANNIAKNLLIPLLELFPDDVPVIAHNFYFECAVLLSEFGVQLSNIYDTKIMHHCLDESSSHGLKDLSKRYLNYDQLHYPDVIERGKTMRDYTGAEIFQYGADDPLVTAHLFDLFYIILNLEGSWEFVKNHEFPTVSLLAESYYHGVSIDWKACETQGLSDTEYSQKCVQQIRDLIKTNQNMDDLVRHAEIWFKEEVRPTLKNLDVAQQHIKDLVTAFWYEDFDPHNKSGKELNLNSYIQKQEILYGMLGLPIRVRVPKISDTRLEKGCKNGEPKTDKDAINEALAWGDAVGWKADVLNLMLEANQASTRCKFFYEKFPLWAHPKDGLIHPQFNSTGTDTRRPTGSFPNLLQLSKRDKGIEVRNCILPNQKMGHDLVCSIDWDGEELRLMAGLSGDRELTSCYLGENLKDVHSIIGAQIAGVNYDYFVSVRKGSEGDIRAKEFDDIRKTGKQVNFAGSYGVGPTKLARMLHCTPSQAKSYLRAKQSAYKEFEAWKDRVVTDLHKKGFVQTLYGNRKHVYDEIFDRDMVGSHERSSVNYLVQGLAADYLKVVLSNLWKKRTFQRHNAAFICALYDEAIFSCHHTQAVSLIQEVYAEMTKGIPGLNIPMLANPALGINFADQVEILADCNQTLTDDLILQTIQKVLPTSKNDESFAKRAVMSL